MKDTSDQTLLPSNYLLFPFTHSAVSRVMVGLSEETSINTVSVEMVGHKSLCKLIRADNNFELTNEAKLVTEQ